jgi:hypothetical protein
VASDTVTHAGSTIPYGIFEEDDTEVVSGEGVVQIVRVPMFTGREQDFPTIADGDAMVINGASFVVKNWERESGVITIMLERS